MKTKRCSTCKRRRLLRNFYANRGQPSGFSTACKECHRGHARKHNKKSYQKNSAAIRARVKVWRAANPDKVAGYVSKHKQTNRCGKYGLTPQEFNTLLRKQRGRCRICRHKLSKPCIDHCHKSNRVRGLLCHLCNVGLGHFRDDAKLLRSAIKYLES